MQFKQPRRVPSAEVQAELYHRLREVGIEVHLEYRAPGVPGYKRGRKCVFDLVIVVDGRILGIIECKRRGRRNAPTGRSGQERAYLSFGISLLWCYGMEDVPEIFERITEGVRLFKAFQKQ